MKTAKLGFIMRRMAERDDQRRRNARLRWSSRRLCAAGMKDVLLAYPVVGANAARVRELAGEHAGVRISVLAENPAQVAAWKGSRLGVFIDLNPGMDRTGIEQDRMAEVLEVARAIGTAGLAFRGLHYYDGHVRRDGGLEGAGKRQRIADITG